MKRNIFLYLFLFTALWVIFQYINNVKVYENQEKRIAKLEAQVQDADTLKVKMEDRLFNAEYFTLNGNDNARDYFDNDNLDVTRQAPIISDGVYAKNTASGNELIPFAGGERPFQINRVQILNHRWLIADFSDGRNWGEIIVEYFINEDGSVDYETVKSLVYPTR